MDVHPKPASAETSPNTEPDRSRPVYFLLHIPKTAGQTMQVHLASHCASGVFWQSQHRLPRRHATRTGQLPDFTRARVISGHHIGRSLEGHYPGREIRRIVLLRNPLQLQISFYNWQMMDNLAKGLGVCSFGLHLKALPRNFISHYLLSRWLEVPWPRLMVMADREKYEMLNRALADFWFVGMHSDCDRVIAALGSDLGVPSVAPPQNTSGELQPATGWRLVTTDTLTPAMRDAFAQSNTLDYALWQGWSDAGFDAASVRPAPLGRTRRAAFPAHEIVRPLFVLRHSLNRQWPAWRGRAGGTVAEADRARDAGEWETAARRYREALRRLPGASAIWVQYGHALKESGHLAAAEAAYRESLGLQADEADTHLQLGHILKLQGRTAEAEAAYLRAAALDPTGADARGELIGLGWTMERLAHSLAGTAAEQVHEVV